MTVIAVAALGTIVAWLCLQPLSEGLALTRKTLRRGRRVNAENPDLGLPSRLLFLVPAHDEELHILDCVGSILALDDSAVELDLVVIADNCSDRTADLARSAGARCLVRTDPELPGKPNALAWAVARLPIEQWDLCIIVDADTLVEKGFARALATQRGLRGRVLQAYNGMTNERESWLTRLAGVLTRIRYDVVFPLKQEVGLNCPTANGVCIGTAVLGREGWRAFSLSETWELYARYTTAGIRIDYVPSARLGSVEASSLSRAGTQRRRWSAGRFWVLRRYGGGILRSGRIGWHQKLDALAELAAPSPVVHAILASLIALTAWLSLSQPAAGALSGGAVASLLPLLGNTVRVLVRHPEPVPTLLAFFMLPIYAAWRFPLAVRTLLTRQDETWQKTERWSTEALEDDGHRIG